VGHQLPVTLSSDGNSWGPWPSPDVAFAPLLDLMPLPPPHEPAPPPVTVNLSQLVVLSSNDYQFICPVPSPCSLLSHLFSDPHLRVDTPAVPPGGEQSPLFMTFENRTHKRGHTSPPDQPSDSSSTYTRSDEDYYESASGASSTEPTTPQHVRHTLSSGMIADQSGPGVVGELRGHPVVRYPNGRYRCMSLITTSGKLSQCTRKSERPPQIGQPCGQTFKGQDEIVRHLKASRWHRKLGEECKPLMCDVCGQRLSRRDALTRHMRTQHTSTWFIPHRLVNDVLTSPSTARATEGAQVYSSP